MRRWRSGIEANSARPARNARSGPWSTRVHRNARSGPSARGLLVFTNPLVRFPAPHYDRRLAFRGVRRWRSGIEANSARPARNSRSGPSARGLLLLMKHLFQCRAQKDFRGPTSRNVWDGEKQNERHNSSCRRPRGVVSSGARAQGAKKKRPNALSIRPRGLVPAPAGIRTQNL